MLIPLLDQLKADKLYRKWMAKNPKLTVVANGQPWVVYVQKEVDGGWARKLFPKYREAYAFMKRRIHDFPDLTINSRRQPFKPPIIIGPKGKPVYRLPQLLIAPDVAHQWCPYCRRLSIFKCFSKHHAFPGLTIRYIDRCVICGIPKSQIKRYV